MIRFITLILMSGFGHSLFGSDFSDFRFHSGVQTVQGGSNSILEIKTLKARPDSLKTWHFFTKTTNLNSLSCSQWFDTLGTKTGMRDTEFRKLFSTFIGFCLDGQRGIYETIVQAKTLEDEPLLEKFFQKYFEVSLPDLTTEHYSKVLAVNVLVSLSVLDSSFNTPIFLSTRKQALENFLGLQDWYYFFPRMINLPDPKEFQKWSTEFMMIKSPYSEDYLEALKSGFEVRLSTSVQFVFENADPQLSWLFTPGSTRRCKNYGSTGYCY